MEPARGLEIFVAVESEQANSCGNKNGGRRDPDGIVNIAIFVGLDGSRQAQADGPAEKFSEFPMSAKANTLTTLRVEFVAGTYRTLL
jgi:hypothetical protein